MALLVPRWKRKSKSSKPCFYVSLDGDESNTHVEEVSGGRSHLTYVCYSATVETLKADGLFTEQRTRSQLQLKSY